MPSVNNSAVWYQSPSVFMPFCEFLGHFFFTLPSLVSESAPEQWFVSLYFEVLCWFGGFHRVPMVVAVVHGVAESS